MMPTTSLERDIEAFLRAAWADSTLQVGAIAPVPEGHAGFTYKVDVNARGAVTTYILKLPPPGARSVGSADVIRQARILDALGHAGLPVPAIVASTERPIVDGRPMVMMEMMEGRRIESIARDHAPNEIGASAVALLKRIQSLGIDKTGIHEDPTTLDQEIDRWSRVCARAVDEVPSYADELLRRLKERKPSERRPTLVHGDFHYGNLLFDGLDVKAVIDWEISAIGQPLIDLASLYVTTASGCRLMAPDLPDLSLSLDEFAGLYGADPLEYRWYVALGCYKYASVVAYNRSLHKRGKRRDAHYESLAESIGQMIAEGLEMLDSYSDAAA